MNSARVFDSIFYFHHCKHAWMAGGEVAALPGPGAIGKPESVFRALTSKGGPAPRPFSGIFRASEIRQC